MHTSNPAIVDTLTHADRSDFISKTYLHVMLAIAAFASVEVLLFSIPVMQAVAATMLSSQFGWLLILVAFMFISNIAHRWAQGDQPQSMQYIGLFTYVVAEAVIFFPLLLVAHLSDSTILPTAALVSLSIFGGLSLFVHLSNIDFSFMGMFLAAATWAALGFIVVSLLFGFSGGSLFTLLMIALASGYIVYNTSNIVHLYRPGQHVAAALHLFASVALLFWYIVQLFMSRD